jgi:transposase-like protein
MSTIPDFPETLQETITYFADEDRAFEFVRGFRWLNGAAQCPDCGSKDNYFLPSGKVWKCKACARKFSLKVGTVFEDSPIKLGTWLCAFWLTVNAKNGISSYEIHRALGVTQKTAWFMLQRIRLALQNGSIVKMSGTVEADETYIGGKARNMHAGKRKATGTGGQGKTAVQGLLERHSGKKASRVVLNVVNNTKRAELQGNVRKYVVKGSEVHTDALKSYNGLGREYVHEVVDHAEEYVRGKVHTNGLENFWALLKRCIKGTHVSIEPFHLFRYLDEQAFRFNERKDNDQGRFLKAVWGIIGKRLTYKKLIGENDGLPATA